ncbi:glycoside hydrolase family 108 protein [Flavobacterium sp. NRK F7]|uniref:glycoside hydrolase family 108 protein n=1 Tax=Flavobacterium sp. NRK F7 TaxID=2954930 RepID=UPI002091CD1D|nr:glycosyl hydrolase 108 family protein [Flavobacterium sp. NRK F7]MCO6162595.1 hypothetical protein [Flavobacterium sp. NRK F7]
MANFNDFLKILHNVEGGYQELENDSGNYNSLGQLVGTNWGISAKTYERWIKRPPSKTDMMNMPKSVAVEIYKQWYWNVMKGSSFSNQSIANIIIDHGVNAGTGTAAMIAQSVLNDYFGFHLSEDGVIGNQTLTAVNSVSQERLHELYMQARIAYYKSLGSSFYRSWMTRLKSFVFKKKA